MVNDKNGFVPRSEEYKAGDILTAEDMNRVEYYLEDLYGILDAEPIITLEKPEEYVVHGTKLELNFSVSNARGVIRYSVLRDGIVQDRGSQSERDFHIDLGTNYPTGELVYTITIEDGLEKTATATVHVHVLDMQFYFSNTDKIDFAIRPSDGQKMYHIERNDQQICFDIGSGQQDGTKVELFYTYGKNSFLLSNPTINDGLYIWDFPAFTHSASGYADEKVVLEFSVKITVASGDDFSTNKLTSVCYCLYADDYKVNTVSNLDNFTDHKRVILTNQLIAVNANQPYNILAIVKQSGVEETRRQLYSIYPFKDFNIDLGLLKEGDKNIEWLIDGNVVDTTQISIHAGSGYTTEGLIAYYNANSYDDGSRKWQPIYANQDYFQNGDSTIRIEGLVEYAPQKEGSRVPAYIRFRPDSFGLLPARKIIEAVNPKEVEGILQQGESFTLELLYKAEYAAEDLAPVIASASGFGAADSFTIAQSIAVASLRGAAISRPLSNDLWNHIALVLTAPISENEGRTVDSIADVENLYILKLYYNGCLIDAHPFSSEKWNSKAFSDNHNYFCINGYYGTGDRATNTGITNLNLIRIYNTGLTATEIMRNYVNAVRSYNEAEADAIEALNDNMNIPKIFFMKNNAAETPITPNDGKIDEDTGNPATTYLANFAELHNIKTKPDRKTKAMNCTVFIVQGNNIRRLNNTDVWLQGTSSLAYPVKNYQIKNYHVREKGSKKGKKSNFLPYINPFVVNAQGYIQPGWGEPANTAYKLDEEQGDYVYTLKCDYMDQSHRNNTPTAMYYDIVLNKVKEYFDDKTGNTNALSPAKEDSGKAFRDSIQGFPVLAYYCDNEKDIAWSGEDWNPEVEGNDGLESLLTSNSVPLGSFMFNIDKEGTALGFELDGGTEQTEWIGSFPIEDYYFEKIESITFNEDENNYTVQALLEEADRMELAQICNQRSEKEFDYLECYAWKINNTSGKYEIIKVGKILLDTLAILENQVYSFTVEPYETIDLSSDQLHLFYFAKMANMVLGIDEDGEPITYKSNYCFSLEGTANSSKPAAATFFTANEASRSLGAVVLHPDTQEVYEEWNKLIYYAATLEPRWQGIEVADETQQTYFDYYQLDTCIKYFKLFTILGNNLNANIAKATFESIFDKIYCLTYYLQMMAFAQVDNSGKNAMFDSWGNGLIYPRPYDMDTQLGLENKGGDTIQVGAELFTQAIEDPQLSVNWQGRGELPEENIDIDDPTIYAGDPNAYRLARYNTRNSKLWKFISSRYGDDLKNVYHKLRKDGIYDADAITEFVDALTCNQISNMQYNRDVNKKYLFPIHENEDDVKRMIAGNRRIRSKQFLTERFAFLDSIWDYDQKVLAEGATWMTSGKIHLRVKSPQYVSIDYATNRFFTKFYVDPAMCYDDGSGRPGITITVPSVGNTNAEVQISGTQGIVALPDYGNVSPKGTMNLSKFPNLSILSIDKSADIENIEPGSCINLTDFTFSNAISSTTQAVTSLDFTRNPYIRSIDCSNLPKLASILLPQPGVVQSLNVIGCPNLTELRLKDLANLTETTLKLGNELNPSAITTLEIDGCNKLLNLNFATVLPKLKTLIIKNCTDLQSLKCNNIKSLQTLVVQNCPALTTVDISETPSLINVNLSNNNALKIVYAKNAQALQRLILSASTDTTMPQRYSQIMLHGCTNLARVSTTPEVLIEYEKLPISEPEDTEAIYFEQSTKKYFIWDNENKTFVTEPNTGIFDFKGTEIVQVSTINDTDLGHQGFRCGAGYIGDKYDICQEKVKQIQNLIYTGSGDSCFVRCKQLKTFSGCKLTLSKTLYSLFGECTALENTTGITFAKAEGATIASMYSVFKECSSLKQISKNTDTDLSEFIAKFVDATTSTFQYAFRTCSAFTKSQILTNTALGNASGITTMRDAFHGAKIKEVKQGAFDSCESLTSVAGIFAGCTQLSTIPQGLFANSPRINDIHCAFDGCTALSGLPSNLLSQAADPIANDSGQKTIDARCLFRNCSLLLINDTPDEKKNILKNFIDALPKDKIGTFETAFYDTGIKYLPENVLDGFDKLSSAVGLFANNAGLINLPATLSSEVSSETAPLLDLSSLFYNCTNLEGVIPATFFGQLKPRISKLGIGRRIESADVSWYRHGMLGAFANTKITNCETGTFTDMTGLTNISALFANGNLESESVSGYSDPRFYLQANESQAQGAFTGNDEYKIDANMFSGCINLTNVTGAFMGTKVEGIDMQGKSPLFDGCPVSKLDLLFASTNFKQEQDESSKYVDPYADPVQLMLENLGDSVTSIAYLCANNPNIVQLYNLNKNTKIQNINGLYASTKLFSILDSGERTIPSNYFSAFAENLVTAAYTFANIDTLKGVSEEIRSQLSRQTIDSYQITWVDRKGYENKLFVNGSSVIYQGYTDEEQQIRRENVTSMSWQTTHGRFAITVQGSTQSNYSYILSNTVNLNIVLDGDVAFQNPICSIYVSDYVNNDIHFWTNRISGLNIIVDGSTDKTYIEIPFNVFNKFGFLHGVEEEPTSTLLLGCYKLQSVEGLFAQSGFEVIPETLFYAPTGKYFEDLTSLKLLFGYCNAGKFQSVAFLSDCILPQLWLEHTPAVNNTSYMFANFGSNHKALGGGVNVPESFNKLPLTTVRGMFADTPAFASGVVTDRFFQHGIENRTLNDCGYLFVNSPLASLNKPFGSQSHSISNFDYAFYNTLSKNISMLPDPSFFTQLINQTTDDDYEYCWGVNNINCFDIVSAQGKKAYDGWYDASSDAFKINDSFDIETYISDCKKDIKKFVLGHALGIEASIKK